MNQRIYDLAEQSNITQYVDVNNEYLKRFAELIICDCATYFGDNSGYDECGNAWFPEAEEMLKHFGVKQ